MSLLKRIKEQFGFWFEPPIRIVVGVSGGADSLALLHLLLRLMGSERLVVAHLDHGWREGSAADAAFVRNTAVSWNIPFHGRRLEEKPESGLEAYGRQARYDFFKQVALCENATFIVVGHTRDDQIETIMMNLIRGSGPEGLTGMEPMSHSGVGNVMIIRPLLHTSRQEIERYCQQHNLHPIQDETNQDTSFLRNRIRHELLPLLQTYNSQFDRHLLQMADILQEENVYLESALMGLLQSLFARWGEGWIALHKSVWQKQRIAMRRRLLRHMMSNLDPKQTEIGYRVINDVLDLIEKDQFGSQYSLPASITVEIEENTILFSLPEAQIESVEPNIEGDDWQSLTPPCDIIFKSGWRLTMKAETMPLPTPSKLEAHLKPVEGQFSIRTRQDGDRVKPLGMNGRSRKLKKIMSEKHVPRHLRDKWPLLIYEDEIVWVPGLIYCEPLKLQGDEKRVIVVQLCN